MDFTVVLGVDRKTIHSLAKVVPTWRRHKPSLLKHQFVVFYDDVSSQDILSILNTRSNVLTLKWPPHNVTYPGDGLTKWTNPQRAKMLSGFVHAPAHWVNTQYWLKLDLDAVAVDHDDWVLKSWFDGNPSIVAPSWGYSKPASQMIELDDWVEQHKPWIFRGTEPLRLSPEPGSDLVRHSRIASWCAFFSTEFTKVCSDIAQESCGIGQLPVPSQDGFMFYVAKRGGFAIRTVGMKKFGWRICGTPRTVEEAVAVSMGVA